MKIGLIAHTVIFNDKKQILVIKRSDSEDVFPSLWDIPGGTVEDGEDPEAAARRELMEEAGLVVDKMSLFSCSSNIDTAKNKQFVCLEFIAKYRGGVVTLNPDDHQEYRWVRTTDLKDLECIPFMHGMAGLLMNHVLLEMNNLKSEVSD